MKKIIMSLLFGTCVAVGAAYAQNNPPPTGPASETPSTAMKPMHRERHPEIRMAMHKLRMAKEALEKSAHDYGGHRVKAIHEIDEAMEELRDALQSDKN